MAKTDTENIDALRTLINGLRGAQELLGVFEDAQAARTVLGEQQARLQKLRQEESDLITRLNGLTADFAERTQSQKAARLESDKAIAAGTQAALQDAARRIDAANEQAAAVERESAARINEANAKAGVAETALAETTARYEAAQRALEALKAKFG